jgi:2-phosphoglycerate kinase
VQDELEEALFAILRAKGYGDEYVRRYQMVTRFFQQKRPLIILIAGSACTGGRRAAAAAAEGQVQRDPPGIVALTSWMWQP